MGIFGPSSWFFFAASMRFGAACLAWCLIAAVCQGSEIVPFVARDQDQRSNLAICNLSPVPAQVTVSLFSREGNPFGNALFNAPPSGLSQINDVIGYFLGNLSQPAFEGYFRLDSNQPLSAFVSQVNLRALDPAFISSLSQPSDHLYVPLVTALAPFQTAVTILNLGNQTSQTELILRGRDGSLLTKIQRLIAPGVQMSEEELFGSPALGGREGTLEIHSLNSSPLAAICRVVSLSSQVGGIVPCLDGNQLTSDLFLHYEFQPGALDAEVLLMNPNDREATFWVRCFTPAGKQATENFLRLAPHAAMSLDHEVLLGLEAGQPGAGLIQVDSDTPLAGVSLGKNVLTGDLCFAQGAQEATTRFVVPSVTQAASFRSVVLVANPADLGTIVRLTARIPSGELAAPAATLFLAPKTSVRLDRLTDFLSLNAGYFGPLEIESLQGQPIYVTSQVANTSSFSRGALEAVSMTPSYRKKIGDSVTLGWAYDPRLAPSVTEFRVYRVGKQGGRPEHIASVSSIERSCAIKLSGSGKHLCFVTAYDGQAESLPSTAVSFEVTP